MFEIQQSGFSSLSEALGAMKEVTQLATVNWATDMAMWIKSELKSRVPVQTGELRESVEYQLQRTSNGAEATFSSLWYGKMLDEGKPESWVIVAQGGKPMAFEWRGSVHFAWSVVHPPITPREFTIKTLDASEPEADRQAEVLGEWILGRFS